jgi:hypothetical protein
MAKRVRQLLKEVPTLNVAIELLLRVPEPLVIERKAVDKLLGSKAPSAFARRRLPISLAHSSSCYRRWTGGAVKVAPVTGRKQSFAEPARPLVIDRCGCPLWVCLIRTGGAAEAKVRFQGDTQVAAGSP